MIFPHHLQPISCCLHKISIDVVINRSNGRTGCF